MVLKAAFATGGSPVTSLEPADDQTAFPIERIREGWGEGVPAVRVVTPALDRNRLLAQVKAIDNCADREGARHTLQRKARSRRVDVGNAYPAKSQLEGAVRDGSHN